MTDAELIADGVLAWKTIKATTTFANWKVIAAAVAAGRSQAMKTAGSNVPFGKRYSSAITVWINANFPGMSSGIRTASCILIDNLAEIEAFRDAAPKGDKLNNPEAVVRAWRRTKPRAIEPRTRPMSKPMTPRYKAKPNHWSQDILRRTAEGIVRNVDSRDIYIVALATLNAAFPTRDHLIEALNENPPPQSRRTAVPAELHEATQTV